MVVRAFKAALYRLGRRNLAGYLARMADAMVFFEVLRDGRRGFCSCGPAAGKAELGRVFAVFVLRLDSRFERKKLI